MPRSGNMRSNTKLLIFLPNSNKPKLLLHTCPNSKKTAPKLLMTSTTFSWRSRKHLRLKLQRTKTSSQH
jgi:hypothetical protein